MPYQVDGREMSYGEMLGVVLDSIEDGAPVHYARCWGIEVYWIDLAPPHWAHEVTLSDEGLFANNKIIERFE